MKPFLKQIFFSITGGGRLPDDSAVILMYHSIAENSDEFTVSPTVFERQMAYLADNKIPVVTLNELVSRLKSHKALGSAVAITFDDGYRDNFTNAFPVLKKYQFSATIFLTSGDIVNKDDSFEYLGTDEIRTMDGSGIIDFGPHTETHPRLSRESVERQQEEVRESKKVVEAITGQVCRLFAYPYGDFDDKTVRIVAEAGFDAAASVIPGTVRAGADVFRLPRNAIDSTTTMAQFRGIVSGAIDRYEALKKWL